ncbi:Glycosyl transferases group 1 [Stieleria maiorica]|uniref:Glycosyl transferases group 1 n=1 Tax=Stieleria maiorica TaxID=2795974 RepID=A0A5B9M920_9BACT|nr:glycosyltransferase [Stieleria maiorica]QEF97701.1 Glycosyl transferases group 1 [Stieleria maiorica]
MIGRHFWPHGSLDSAGHLMELATGFKLAGVHVSVVTPKHAASWAERFSFRECQVYRPIRMFRTGWTARGDRTSSRYIRYLRDWIESNPVACDMVYCDSGREEAIAAVEAARAIKVPSVVRLAGHGSCSDLEYHLHSRTGRRCRAAVMEATAVVVDSASAHRRWLADGGDRERVHRIPVGIGPAPDRGWSSPKRLRRAMARINGDLFVPDSCSVVLSVERLDRSSGVMTLVKSAYSLAQKIQGLQFWIVGDGPLRETIYAQLRSDGLRQSMAMPGSFSSADDVFSAADLMVHAGDEGFEHQIPTAIAAGLPLILANTETAREFFGVTDSDVQTWILRRRAVTIDAGDAERADADASHPDDPPAVDNAGRCVWWFDPKQPKTLRFAIEQIVDNLQQARRRAQQARRVMQRTRSRSESIERFVTLFRQLASGQPRRHSDPTSMENAQ